MVTNENWATKHRGKDAPSTFLVALHEDTMIVTRTDTGDIKSGWEMNLTFTCTLAVDQAAIPLASTVANINGCHPSQCWCVGELGSACSNEDEPATTTYTKAPAGTNCEPSQVTSTLAGCLLAAAEFGVQTAHLSNRSAGCFWDSNGQFYFNQAVETSIPWEGTGGVCSILGARSDCESRDGYTCETTPTCPKPDNGVIKDCNCKLAMFYCESQHCCNCM
jgi:hypothetical protein